MNRSLNFLALFASKYPSNVNITVKLDAKNHIDFAIHPPPVYHIVQYMEQISRE